MKISDIPYLRLHNQGISDAQFKNVRDVVTHLGAVQAQDYQASLWAIGLRMPSGTTPADIEKAVAKREIVRMWPMRGTLHFVPSDDARWMLELMQPRVMASYPRRHKFHGVTEDHLSLSRKVITKALKGGKALTREGLYKVLEKAGIATASSRGLHILGRMAHDPLICFGSRDGKQPTFVLFDEWLPNAKSLPRDESLAKLTRTYFTGHGPAMIQDCMWWSGLSGRDIKAGIEMNKSKLVSETVDGKTFWMAPKASSNKAKPSAYLLPPFDEYIVGYKDRNAVLEDIHRQKINPGLNGVLSAVVVINGQVVGNWKKELKNKSAIITVQPFTSFTQADRRLIARAAEQYGKFIKMSVVVR